MRLLCDFLRSKTNIPLFSTGYIGYLTFLSLTARGRECRLLCAMKMGNFCYCPKELTSKFTEYLDRLYILRPSN